MNTGRCHRNGCPFLHHADVVAERQQYTKERKQAKQQQFEQRMVSTLETHAAYVSQQPVVASDARRGLNREGHETVAFPAGDQAASVFVPKRMRARIFCDFLVDTFGTAVLSRGRGVIDVAGGRGEVSFELFTRRGIPSTCVDPRPTKLSREQLKYLKKNRAAVPPPHLTCLFGATMLSDPEQEELLRGASVVVAMHPDEATELAVDFAIARGLPWAVVPCCVFARDNPQRLTLEGQHVTTYEQYLAFLQRKQPGVATAVMGFAGRNVVLYSRQGLEASVWSE